MPTGDRGVESRENLEDRTNTRETIRIMASLFGVNLYKLSELFSNHSDKVHEASEQEIKNGIHRHELKLEDSRFSKIVLIERERGWPDAGYELLLYKKNSPEFPYILLAKEEDADNKELYDLLKNTSKKIVSGMADAIFKYYAVRRQT